MLLVLQPKTMEDEQFDEVLQTFANSVATNSGFTVLTIGVKDLKEIRVLDEKLMNHYGWYRKPAGVKLQAWLDKLAAGDEEE